MLVLIFKGIPIPTHLHANLSSSPAPNIARVCQARNSHIPFINSYLDLPLSSILLHIIEVAPETIRQGRKPRTKHGHIEVHP
jgi:hypothetical protein